MVSCLVIKSYTARVSFIDDNTLESCYPRCYSFLVLGSSCLNVLIYSHPGQTISGRSYPCSRCISRYFGTLAFCYTHACITINDLCKSIIYHNVYYVHALYITITCFFSQVHHYNVLYLFREANKPHVAWHPITLSNTVT